MNDEDRRGREKDATAKLLDAYEELVGMAILEATSGDEARRLTDTVKRMTENQAKALLLARIGADARAQVQATLRDDPKGN
jgi:hypothetical protein